VAASFFCPGVAASFFCPGPGLRPGRRRFLSSHALILLQRAVSSIARQITLAQIQFGYWIVAGMLRTIIAISLAINAVSLPFLEEVVPQKTCFCKSLDPAVPASWCKTNCGCPCKTKQCECSPNPCPCANCPPTGYTGACCHGNTTCEPNNWSPTVREEANSCYHRNHLPFFSRPARRLLEHGARTTQNLRLQLCRPQNQHLLLHLHQIQLLIRSTPLTTVARPPTLSRQSV
jgi:hypothetical protein